jgi:hypothetical protein
LPEIDQYVAAKARTRLAGKGRGPDVAAPPETSRQMPTIHAVSASALRTPVITAVSTSEVTPAPVALTLKHEPPLDPLPSIAPVPPSLDVPNAIEPASPVLQTPKVVETPVPVPAQPEAKVRWWPVPRELLAELDRLREFPEGESWANRVRAALDELGELEGPYDPRAIRALEDLEDLIGEHSTYMPLIPEGPRATCFRQAGLALVRRVDLWQELPYGRAAESGKMFNRDPKALMRALQAAAGENAKSPGSKWGRYLLLDEFKLLEGDDADTVAERQRLAGLVLGRLERAGVTPRAENFASHPLAGLHAELRRWAVVPLDGRNLIFDVEQFEDSGLPSDAHRVADHYRRVAWAEGRSQKQLATALSTHYRNANLRLTLSSDLLNRMVDTQPAREMYIQDMVLGNPTRGWSTTWTDVGFRLLPDANHARLLLEARGRVSADTITIASIVKLRSQSYSQFLATKELQIGLSGLRSGPAWVDASSTPRLRSIETDLDFVPVMGLVMQSVAETSFENNQPRARLEARQKITQRVRDEMDRELAARIERANGKFRDHVLTPLENLDLAPELIESQTTEDRVTLRIRLATDEQLAGHGPRPRAPSDSLASAQVHQSVINNICEQLHWEGRTFTLPQLREDFARRLNRAPPEGAEDEHKELQITFAAKDAVRVQCKDDRIELNLSIAQLKLNKDMWRNFVVRVYYRPNLSTPQGRLERDGTVQLISSSLGARAQITLRSIFTKAFPQSHGIAILPDDLGDKRPGLKNMGVSQFEIDEEWIGLAFAIRNPKVLEARKVGN